MNVAIFTDNDFDKVNGVTTTLNAALAYAPADVRLRIYTAADVGVDRPNYLALRSIGVPIPFYGEMRMYLPRVRDYLRRVRADRIDVVHVTTPGPVGLAGLYVAWRLRLPVVGSFHTDLAAYTQQLSGSARLGALMREYMRGLYSRCARVLVPSESTRRLLEGPDGDRGRMDIWPRGVDTSLFDPARRSERLRTAWHVSDRRPAVLYVGRISQEKGLSLLPALQHRLHALGVEHRLVLAGRGPMEGELKRALPDAVFTGVLSREAVAEVFASADLFLFPSRTDTAGNVVLEAQASGLPVIVAGQGGPRENVDIGHSGLVCETEASEDWAGLTVSLLRDRARLAAMRMGARRYALSRRWEQALEPLYRAYRDVGDARARDVRRVLPATAGGRA